MKTFIVGMRGIGVTHFLKNELLPKIDESKRVAIMDFTGEWAREQSVAYQYQTLPFHEFRTAREIRLAVGMCLEVLHKDAVIILDSWKSYLSPQAEDPSRPASADNPATYKWLNDLLKNRTAILTTLAMRDLSAFRDIEKIYKFRTLDEYPEIEATYSRVIEHRKSFREAVEQPKNDMENNPENQ